ncbi:hypothetical protein C8R44DRAFT_879471 [Mycena epipterygia]|nr:hypothetical protein C8R44DRAFT_879471 [Mycena epipterygia]
MFLVALLYSDKKPGAVATRQLIVDLLLLRFDSLNYTRARPFPPSAAASSRAAGDRVGCATDCQQPHHPARPAQDFLVLAHSCTAVDARAAPGACFSARTTHLKLVNTISKAVAELNLPKEHDHSVLVRYGLDLAQGIDDVLLDTAGRAGYVWTVSRLVGVPPPALAKSGWEPQGQRQIDGGCEVAFNR